MRITDLLKQDTAILDLQAQGKEAVIDELIAKLNEAGRLADPQAFREAIMLRESHSTTGLGDGVAIPRSADPIRVLTSCILGSAIACGHAMAFGITLPASHGGIFVIALLNKPLLYLLAILIGSVLSAFTLGVWKKKIA